MSWIKDKLNKVQGFIDSIPKFVKNVLMLIGGFIVFLLGQAWESSFKDVFVNIVRLTVEFFAFLWTSMLWIASLDVPLYVVVLSLIICSLIFHIYKKKNEQTVNSDIKEYRRDEFAGWVWTWDWIYYEKYNTYEVNNLQLICDVCKTRMQTNQYTGYSVCARCELDGVTSERHNDISGIKSLIYDGAKNRGLL